MNNLATLKREGIPIVVVGRVVIKGTQVLAGNQRDRLGRLLTALAYNPFAIGIGLDEDTAAFIGPDETVEVEGSGGVMIVDASDVSFSSMDAVSEGQPVCLLGLKLHMLVAGATYNLHTRLAQAGSLNVPKE